MKNRIKNVRTKNGLSQTDFAKKLSISRSAVCKMESGENSPSEQTITLICKEFDINEAWLRTGEGEPEKKRTKNQEIQKFANDVMEDLDETFRKRFVLALSKLNEEDWEVIEKIIHKIKEED